MPAGLHSGMTHSMEPQDMGVVKQGSSMQRADDDIGLD